MLQFSDLDNFNIKDNKNGFVKDDGGIEGKDLRLKIQPFVSFPI